MIDLGDLERQKRAIMADLEDEAIGLIRRIFLLLFADLVRMTPVDTGYARSGWMGVAGGSPPTDKPPEGTTSTPRPPLSEAQRARLGMILWIVNNVDYIQRLDDGWSKQAPAGMTSVAFANLEARFS